MLAIRRSSIGIREGWQRSPAPSESTPAIGSGSRRALAESGGTARTTRVTRSASRQAAAAAASSSSSTPTLAPPKPQPNARVAVFVDGQDDSGSNAPDDAPSAWPDLGTRKSRIKENVKEATKAAGTTLKQAGRSSRVASSSRTPKITVFRDTEMDEGDEENHPASDSPEPPLPTPPVAVKVSKSSSSKSIPVFRDEEPEPPKLKNSKPGRSIDVFQDEEPQHPPKVKNGKGLAVFRDDEPEAVPEPGPPKKVVKSTKKEKGKGIAVFSDPSPPEAGSSKAGKGIAVFRDDSEDPSPVQERKASTGAKGMLVFRDDDDEPRPPQKTKSVKAGKAVSVFRDDGNDGAGGSQKVLGIPVFRDESEGDAAPQAGSSSSSKHKSSTSKLPSKSKSPISVFCDDGEESQLQSKKPMPKAKRGAIPVFRDEEVPVSPSADGGDAEESVASPTGSAGFKPFKDEDEEGDAHAPTKNKGLGLGILGQGASSGSVTVKMSLEAEALRKDPLKNYTVEERTSAGSA
ncbi:hypothetical protein BC629DRAFT_1484382 [Irpex lacteus]|nr:hypothetical protein BC629DRAFT_1484382 [Irpex lacteus]